MVTLELKQSPRRWLLLTNWEHVFLFLLHLNISILGCQWVYKFKLNYDRSIAHCKARLVAYENQQEYDIDYKGTFSPVTRWWFFTFSNYLFHLGFVVSQVDQSLFLYNHNNIHFYVFLYMDDMLITGNNKTQAD